MAKIGIALMVFALIGLIFYTINIRKVVLSQTETIRLQKEIITKLDTRTSLYETAIENEISKIDKLLERLNQSRH